MVTHVSFKNVQSLASEAQSTRDTARGSAVRGTAPAASTSRAGETEPPVEIPTLDSSKLEAAMNTMTRSAQSMQRSLQFSVDESSGRTIITVIDKETDEIIRQIPPEEVVALTEHFEGRGGLLLRAEA